MLKEQLVHIELEINPVLEIAGGERRPQRHNDRRRREWCQAKPSPMKVEEEGE